MARFMKENAGAANCTLYSSKEKIISHVATEKLKKIGAKIRAIVIRALGNQLFC